MKEYFFRYQRQIILEGFGIEAQKKLTNSSVLVIGAGGLGCPILQYLAAAGIGCLGIADDDTIALPNLNRQLLFGQEDVGKSKVLIVEEKIRALNHLTKLIPYNQRCDQTFALTEFPKYDVIVDATDNFASRYLINDACVLLNKPLVFGAVSRFEGQIAVFNVMNQGICLNYRDLFPEPPKNDEVLSCGEAGVLGVLPGLIGVMQATEVIKLITGVGEPLANQMLTYNALQQSFYKMQLMQHPESAKYLPANVESFLQINYESLCN